MLLGNVALFKDQRVLVLMKKVRIGTRKSKLALWQAQHVKNKLEELYTDLETEVIGISTKGDRLQSASLSGEGGKGLFLKELEEALLTEHIDIAIHSMKDVPAALPDGLHIPVICKRGDPRDAFISTRFEKMSDLPTNAHVGTSSLRRQCLILHALPNTTVVPIRGNIARRLERLDEGNLDAIILAVAGLQRIGFERRIRQVISLEDMLPAVGQGAIGVECLIKNESVNQIIQPLNHLPTQLRLRAERAGNKTLNGSCHLPVAFYSELNGKQLHLQGMVGMPDGTEILFAEEFGLKTEPELVGTRLAQKLQDMGADRILSYVKHS